MALLTPELLEEIRDIIKNHHAAVVVALLGDDALPAPVLEELKAKGLIPQTAEGIADAYLYGHVAAMLEDPAVPTWSAEKLKEYAAKNPVPLTNAEKAAAARASTHAAEYVKGLGNTVAKDAVTVLVNADQQLAAKMGDAIEDTVATGVEARKTVKAIKSDLGHKTGDWTRNLDRIVITEKHNAMQVGVADQIAKQHGDDARVAIIPMPDACQHCKRLHLGPDGQPRIFKLSQLAPAGANVGQKPINWVPSVGAVHPHCHPPGTMIETSRGRVAIEDVRPGARVVTHEGKWQTVTHTWESQYEGTLVTVSGNGWELRATPDHRLMDSGGSWIRAEDLQKGDDLLGCVDGDALTPDVYAVDLPTGGDKGRLLARILFGFGRCGVPVAAVDFNGEIFLWEREVDQEGSPAHLDGEAGNRVQPRSDEDVVDAALMGRFEATSLSDNTAPDLVGSLFAPSYRGVRGGSEGQALRRAHPAVADELRLAASAWREPQAFQTGTDSSVRSSDTTGYLLYREAVVEVLFDGGFVEFAPVASGRLAHARGVRKAIVSVNSAPFVGCVYNLTVHEDHSFVANGIVSHNCQCQLVRVPNGWGFDEAGDLVPAGEFGVEYEGESLTKALWLEEERAEFLEKAAYKLADRTTWRGMDVSIEQLPGDMRFWKDRNGESGITMMRYAYGYLCGTEGVDGDHVDVYLGPDPSAATVYVVHQRKKLGEGKFGGYDEDKCMLDFPSLAAAKAAYLEQYDDPGFLGAISVMPVDEFVQKVKATKHNPKKLEGTVVEKGGERLVLREDVLEKAGPYIGPRGGKSAVGNTTFDPRSSDIGKAESSDTRLDPAIGGATVEQDVGHVTGTGSNIQAGSPPMNQGERQSVANEKFFLKQPEPRDIVIRRDQKLYEVTTGSEHVYPLQIGDGQYAEVASAPNDAEEHKEELQRLLLQDNDVPRNASVNPGWAAGPREGAALRAEDQGGSQPVLERKGKKRKRTAVAKSVPKELLE